MKQSRTKPTVPPDQADTVFYFPDDTGSRAAIADQAPRAAGDGGRDRHPLPRRSAFDGPITRRAAADAFRKLDPRVQLRNPVMFTVYLAGAVTTVVVAVNAGGNTAGENVFGVAVTLFLWATVLFANFAEAMAEGRGKAQADALRATRTGTTALVRRAGGATERVAAADLEVGDECVVAPGETIPGDGDVIEGIASVDESAITGESAPVIRESGGDRSAVTGGTTVLSDGIVVRVTAKAGETFLDRMIALVEGAERKKTPNEVALTILLSGLTMVFLAAVVTLQPLAVYSGAAQDVVVLVALLVCLIPTTIGALLSAIGIAGMDRMVRSNVLARSGRAVEAAGDVTTLLLDKTGTITLGSRQAAEFLALPGVDPERLAAAALRSSLADGTPEGRSVVDFARARSHTTYPSHPSHASHAPGADDPDGEGTEAALGTSAVMVPFTAESRMSGIDDDGLSTRKGATDAVRAWVADAGGTVPDALEVLSAGVAGRGGTPLAVAEADTRTGTAEVLGVIHLKDTVKPGMRERFDQLRAMGIRTVMVTGDNRRTAEVIAREAGVDDVLAEARPEDKLALIRREQAGGALVAMAGDGTNDAPALAQADVGLAMNTGTQAAKEAGNMVDLDSDPTKLIDVVRVGKQLLITRGALTTFSIANDVAKYFAILPAMFAGVLPALGGLNVMGLESAHSAILSAVVFNALIIVALVPLALRGVRFRPLGAADTLRRNLLVYGLGGLVVPFVGIKLIDTLISATGVL